ncbi:mandelate racemase [Acuticoccus sp. 2012]|uniref:Mandelate racemase n=1 Tax=Acuticoccus mangrovi TaxID=2796142 RepID=A0A934IPU1_9HYPH|nr:mandelate racemase [Acuticoccus mangrovi]
MDTPTTLFGLHAAAAPAVSAAAAARGLPPLVASFGPALLDRAILDAVLRLEGLSVFEAAKRNLFGLDARLTPDLAGFDVDAFLATLAPSASIALRHTVGMVDPIRDADLAAADRLNDGLPETLEEVVKATGVTHFKLKVGGDLAADIDRLLAIAGVIDTLPSYKATLDGNEQYRDVEGVVALWRAIGETPGLAKLREAILFIEQPIVRTAALGADIGALAALKPVEIDESDATLDAFPTAKALGYEGVSSKSCKGFYRSLLNRARCAWWNAQEGRERYFMSAEDLTTQAGLGVQQDLALATLIGCTHVERNGHHYVNGFEGTPESEQAAFLDAHPDLYHRADGTVRVTVEDGRLAIGSLATPGLGSKIVPSFDGVARVEYEC